MHRHNQLFIFGMLALVLVLVVSMGFSHTVYAVGFDESNGNSGGGWGGLPPAAGEGGGGPGTIQGPGSSGQPGGPP
jgi:hypothetical protein